MSVFADGLTEYKQRQRQPVSVGAKCLAHSWEAKSTIHRAAQLCGDLHHRILLKLAPSAGLGAQPVKHCGVNSCHLEPTM